VPGFINSTSRPIELAVLNCCVTDTNDTLCFSNVSIGSAPDSRLSSGVRGTSSSDADGTRLTACLRRSTPRVRMAATWAMRCWDVHSESSMDMSSGSLNGDLTVTDVVFFRVIRGECDRRNPSCDHIQNGGISGDFRLADCGLMDEASARHHPLRFLPQWPKWTSVRSIGFNRDDSRDPVSNSGGRSALT
jgi:hypothetical protein